MDCPYAYEKPNIGYILCRKEAEPTRFDREKLFHAVCAHQVDCPKQNCRKLSSGWERCAKLAQPHRETYDEVFPDMVQEPDAELKPAKKSRKKAEPED